MEANIPVRGLKSLKTKGWFHIYGLYIPIRRVMSAGFDWSATLTPASKLTSDILLDKNSLTVSSTRNKRKEKCIVFIDWVIDFFYFPAQSSSICPQPHWKAQSETKGLNASVLCIRFLRLGFIHAACGNYTCYALQFETLCFGETCFYTLLTHLHY